MMKQYYLDKINKCEKKIAFFDDEYDQLVEGVDNQIDGSDELRDFYLVIKRIEVYEKEGK